MTFHWWGMAKYISFGIAFAALAACGILLMLNTEQQVGISELPHALRAKKFSAVSSTLHELSRISNSSPDTEEQLYYTLRALGQIGSAYEGAISEWVTKQPANAHALLARAHYHYASAWHARDYGYVDTVTTEMHDKMVAFAKAAVRDADAAIALDNTLALAHLMLAEASKLEGNDGSVENHIDRALSLSPTSYVIRARRIRMLQPRWGGSYDRMNAVIDKAQPYVAANPRLKLLPGFIAIDQAATLSELERLDEALPLALQAAALGSNAEASYRLADLYYDLKNYSVALQHANEAVRLHPYYDLYHRMRAQVHYTLKDFAALQADLVTLRDIAPDSPSIKFVEKLITKSSRSSVAATIDPNSPEGMIAAARTLIQQQDYAGALTKTKQAVASKPDSFEAVQLLDWLLARERKFAEVVAEWNRYLALRPDDAKAHMERGGAYYHMQKRDLAIQDAKKACELGLSEGCTMAAR